MGDKKITVVTVCNCKKLNVREKPNKESEILHIVNAGDQLETTSSMSGTTAWIKISVGDVHGFVMKEYVKED